MRMPNKSSKHCEVMRVSNCSCSPTQRRFNSLWGKFFIRFISHVPVLCRMWRDPEQVAGRVKKKKKNSELSSVCPVVDQIVEELAQNDVFQYWPVTT